MELVYITRVSVSSEFLTTSVNLLVYIHVLSTITAYLHSTKNIRSHASIDTIPDWCRCTKTFRLRCPSETQNEGLCVRSR